MRDEKRSTAGRIRQVGLALGLECFDDPRVAQELARQGVDPNRFLQAEDFVKALEFIQSLGVKIEDLAYRMEPENIQFVQDISPEEDSGGQNSGYGVPSDMGNRGPEGQSAEEKEAIDRENEGEEVIAGGAVVNRPDGGAGGEVLTKAEKQIDIMEQLMRTLPKPTAPGAQFVTPLPAPTLEPNPLPPPPKKMPKRSRRVVLCFVLGTSAVTRS